jgi:hypothetical protein
VPDHGHSTNHVYIALVTFFLSHSHSLTITRRRRRGAPAAVATPPRRRAHAVPAPAPAAPSPPQPAPRSRPRPCPRPRPRRTAAVMLAAVRRTSCPRHAPAASPPCVPSPCPRRVPTVRALVVPLLCPRRAPAALPATRRFVRDPSSRPSGMIRFIIELIRLIFSFLVLNLCTCMIRLILSIDDCRPSCR